MEGGVPGGAQEWLPTTGDVGRAAGAVGGVGRDGGTLPYREATELLECIRIMGRENTAYCHEQVLGETVPTLPILQKTTVSGPSARNNGGFSWGARWSLQNASSSTEGWIVQHVVVRHNVVDASDNPIVPGQGGYGGLSTAWYPLWEAWQVRGGQVFVGGGASPHNADTYAQSPVGPNTKGSTEVVGRADFYLGLTLPTSFTVRNSAPAWALPVTNTSPSLTGGTGALDHNLTATWDGVGGTGTTTLAAT